MGARDIAFKVLLQVERADAYLNLALDAALKSAGAIARQDAALATELAYGVARRRLTLDAIIARHADRPLTRLETRVHLALQLGAYQLVYLTRVPAHAAVSETVALVKREGLGRAAGFVNAVLRKVASDPTPKLPDDALGRLAVEESHPRWLAARWAERFGLEEARALCHADNEPAPVTVRVNVNRTSRDALLERLAQEGVGATPAAVSPLGLVLENPGQLPGLDSFKEGLFQVQDEAAQLVGLLPHVHHGLRVLDACAAPGGKTCHLAERLGAEGQVVAVDLYARKLERLASEAERLGLTPRIRTLAHDAATELPFEEASFDVALLDAPCSGTGTLRRHPELRYRRKPDDLARLAELQRSIAANVVRYLKRGGELVYAVCSMEPEEGEAQLAYLESLGLGLRPADEPMFAAVRAPSGGIATFPHRHRTDGFFAVRLQKA